MDESNLIFHYTNANALIEIVTNRTLWATDVNFMNDKRDVLIAKNHLTMLINSLVSSDKSEINLYCEEIMNRLVRVSKHSYLTSFSTNSDNLSLYRTYCSPDGGYCIGFEKKYIQSISNAKLIKCCYSGQYESCEVKNLFNDIISDIKIHKEQDLNVKDVLKAIKTSYFDHLMDLSYTLKSNEFETEKEYRLVIETGENPKVRASSKGNIVVPYIASELPNIATDVMITLDPNTNMDIAKIGFQTLAKIAKDVGCRWNIALKVGDFSGYRHI